MKRNLLFLLSIALVLATATQCGKSPDVAYSFSLFIESVGEIIYDHLTIILPFTVGFLIALFKDSLKISLPFKQKTKHEHQ